MINKFNINQSLYILAGSYFDIIVGDNLNVDKKNNFKANISKGEDIDFGFTGGVGVSLPKGISFDARIKKGTRDAIDDNSGSLNVDTNLVYQIGATYTFGIK